jgi:hypothetical protein
MSRFPNMRSKFWVLGELDEEEYGSETEEILPTPPSMAEAFSYAKDLHGVVSKKKMKQTRIAEIEKRLSKQKGRIIVDDITKQMLLPDTGRCTGREI